ncbi:MAG: methionine gamma-lyase [Alphaproteobacteria bacterium]|nr:methionine gamma-lyase [Alphaproteobacteria bacterium]
MTCETAAAKPGAQPDQPVHRPASDAGFETRAIHHGYDPADADGALTPPVHFSSTYAFESAEGGAARFAGESTGYIYSRVGNPTLDLLERRLASLEGAEAGLATASGMGAIAATVWTLIGPGDEILTDKTLYGCTFAFFRRALERFGVRIRHIDMTRSDAVAEAIGERTALIFFETPANPNMRLIDIEATARAARPRGVPVVVDNTYATPYLQRPIELGADLVVHSATKYLGGHGDLMAGAVLGDAETIGRIRMEGLKDMTGAVLSSFDAMLILRGLKTLGLRMARHCATAEQVAGFLETARTVARVHYPGLDSFPQRALARRQMRLPGGMIAFELPGGLAAGQRFIDATRLFTRAVSLGDAESLVQHPASMTHSTYTAEERARHGIADGLVRLSVGLETPEDILADVAQALEAAAEAG